MSAIAKIEVELVDCPACRADCDFDEHAGWSECALCGGTGDVDVTVAAVFSRRAVACPVPAPTPVADDDDISF